MANKDYRGFRDLKVYQKSYELAIEVTKLSKSFPREEKYSLTDQIRRSSRSIPVNIAEAWAKRIYSKSFVAKIIDAYGEELETEVWLDMALDFEYIDKATHEAYLKNYQEVRKMLNYMSNYPDTFCK